MKVKAKRLGYYGLVRRKPGDVFHIDGEEHFSEKWMEKADDSAALGPAEEAPEVDSEDDEDNEDVI